MIATKKPEMIDRHIAGLYRATNEASVKRVRRF
jgi:hypothetical protein